MSSFFKSLLDEIKSDLKSEIRSETKSFTQDAIKDVKDALKPKKEETVSPQEIKKQVNEELHDDKVFGKTIDEYKEIFQRLREKHGDNIPAIYADEEYQKLDAETKEYINRVYFPTIESAVKTTGEAFNELGDATKDRAAQAQEKYDAYNKDGVISEEEQADLIKEGMQVYANEMNELGNIAPKYLDKFGDMAKDLSEKIENEDVKQAVSNLGDEFKSSEYQNQTKENLTNYASKTDSLSSLPDKLSDSKVSVNNTVSQVASEATLMQQNLKTTASQVGMSASDVKNAFEEGKTIDSSSAANQSARDIKTLTEAAKNDPSKAEELTKQSLENALKTFGSLFGGDK